jgi:hypothetical protein
MEDGIKSYFPTGLLVLHCRGSPVREHDPWPSTGHIHRRLFGVASP